MQLIMNSTTLYRCLGWCLLLILGSSCGNHKYLKSHSKSVDHPQQRVYDELMVIKNKINLDQQKYKIKDEELLEYQISTIIRQTPDHSILGGIRQAIYHANDTLSIRYVYDRKVHAIVPDTIRRVPNRFRSWVGNKLGKAPVVLDSVLTNETAESMRNFLHQKAYFDAKVTYTVKTRNHKASVEYHIETGMPILVDSVTFSSKDSTIQRILEQIRPQTILEQGSPLSLENLTKEKQRLALAIRNQGYYNFSWNYILIQADTANARKVAPSGGGWFNGPLEQGEPRANVYVEVLPHSDTMINHPRYRVCNVFITPNEVILKAHQRRRIEMDSFFVVERILKDRYRRVLLKPNDAEEPDDIPLRSWTNRQGQLLRLVKRSKPRIKKVTLNSRTELEEGDRLVHIILRKTIKNRDGSPATNQQRRQKYYIRDRVISNAVTIKAGDYYSYEGTRTSIRRIDKLNVFRLPRVECLPNPDRPNDCLDCIVRMQPSKKQELGADFDLNNNQTTVSSLGISTNLNYQNKNIFKGAEIFEITAFGGIDFKIGNVDSTDQGFFEQAVNLLDINLETSLYFPRYLGLNILERALKMDRARTRISVGYRYLQQSTDFRISSFYTKMGYEWSRGPEHAFTWNPFVLNLTFKPVLDSGFERLLRENNIALYESLSASFLIPSTDFTYTYTGKEEPYGGAWSFRSTFEMAGNLFYLLDQIVKPNERMRFGGVDYSQYVSTDFDVRYTYNINKRNSIALRTMLGFIVPYGNSLDTDVPFVKRFTMGGPTSMRAWNLRFLGPGDQPSVAGAEFQIGDIRAEFNAEYRFKINSWVELATFADIGNIWLLDADEVPQSIPRLTPKLGVFTSQFYEQFAIGAGIGIRFDLSFFTLRFDYAFQVREPQGYGLLEDGTIQYWNDNPFLQGRRKIIIAIGYPF